MGLREYQKVIAEKIDRLFKGIGREERSFVGVKLPTGGGKTFIFMDQFVKFYEEYNKENPNEDNDCISRISVKYYSPLTGINLQTQIKISKYIILEEYIKKFKSDNKIDELEKIKDTDIKKVVDIFSERILNKTGKKGKKRAEIKEKIEYIYTKRLEKKEDSEEIIKKILLDVIDLTDDVEKLVKGEFPNLEFNCYQKNEKIDSNSDVKLVIFDEAHRIGAKKWGKNAKRMMEKYSKAKFLAITATPERDVDGKDPMGDFAKISGYTVSELRKRDYLASDMNLVTALLKGLVVKPEVVNFDCLLDETIEYENVKKQLENLQKKVEQSEKALEERQRMAIRSGKTNLPEQTKTEKRNYNEYNEVLFNFCLICKLSGKLDFVKMHLSPDNKEDRELLEFLEKPELTRNYIYLNLLKDKIYEIDDEKTDIHKEYKEWKSKKVKSIIDKAIETRPYLRQGKYLCLTPLSDDATKTKYIMEEYRELMKGLFGLADEDVLITHSNTDVISATQDRSNLKKYMAELDLDDPVQIMVAMKKFDEGLHVDGIVAEFMCRQIDDRTTKKKGGIDDDPKTAFLQQLGRCIYAIDPNEEITEFPVVFDFACNFMRYNEKLHNIFDISDNQRKFKELYDNLFPKKVKPTPEIVIDILQVLSENNVDVSRINKETTWATIEKNIPKEKLDQVLDRIYELTDMRIKPEYEIGLNLISTRNAFWKRTAENKISGGTKKYCNSAMEKFFKTQTFEKLHRIGFFKDLEIDRDKKLIDENGFIIGECADLDGGTYGFNIYSGTRYTPLDERGSIPPVDINGFTRKGIHLNTGIRYNEKFFSYDPETGSWTNLFTGRDEDLLGYDHNGNIVNPNCDHEYDQYGFNRDGIHRDTHCRFNKEGFGRRDPKVSKRPECYFPIRSILKKEFATKLPDEKRKNMIEKYLIEWTVLSRIYKPIKKSDWYRAVIVENYEKKEGRTADSDVFDMCKESQESMILLNNELLEILQKLDEEIRENDTIINNKQNEKKQLIEKVKMLLTIFSPPSPKGDSDGR